jgi:DNA processing protein
MSGLSLGTVVIEASETSGALIQARKALQQGRKLFIPRSAVENERLRWPKNYAERPGAYVFGTIDELVSVLEAENLLPRREVMPAAATAVGLHAS